MRVVHPRTKHPVVPIGKVGVWVALAIRLAEHISIRVKHGVERVGATPNIILLAQVTCGKFTAHFVGSEVVVAFEKNLWGLALTNCIESAINEGYLVCDAALGAIDVCTELNFVNEQIRINLP